MIDSLPMTMLTITDLSEGRSDVGTARRSRPSTDTEHRRRLFHAISSYVFTRAHDPQTTPQSIARAHGMSLRYLQAIFAENGATPAHHLRRCRLELAAQELTEHRSSSEAAARSGFSDPATKAFAPEDDGVDAGLCRCVTAGEASGPAAVISACCGQGSNQG
jgi:AraC-like DNA-binding protein